MEKVLCLNEVAVGKYCDVAVDDYACAIGRTERGWFVASYNWSHGRISAGDCMCLRDMYNRPLNRIGWFGSLSEIQSLALIIQSPASIMSPSYESAQIYTGVHDYHAHHSGDLGRKNKFVPKSREAVSPYMMGVELEVDMPTQARRDVFAKSRSNWFFMEKDCSLGEYGIECITVPLQPKHAKDSTFWSGLIRPLSAFGATSWNTRHCGLHVHVSREILGATADEQSDAIGRLLYLYYYILSDSLKQKIFGRDVANYVTKPTSRVAEAVKILPAALHANEAVKAVTDDLKNISKDNRSHQINLTNAKTIEFRQGRGSVNANRVAAVCEFVELICRYAVSEKKLYNMTENKFVMYVNNHVCSNSCLLGYMSNEQ